MNIPDGITTRGCTPTEKQNPNFIKNQKTLEEKGDLIICDTDNCNRLVILEEEKSMSMSIFGSDNSYSYMTNRIVSTCYRCNTILGDNCANIQEHMIERCPLDPKNFGCFHSINGELSDYKL